jgi:hypothetical protein
MSDSNATSGTPSIEIDEWRDEPRRHRFVHGIFPDTQTRFTFYFPPLEHGLYGGRFVHYFQGGGWHEQPREHGDWILDLVFDRLGGYLVDSTPGGYDAVDIGPSAKSAVFSKTLAAALYGAAPKHGYAFGPSGGGVRSISAIEDAPEVYSGVVPLIMGGFGDPAQSWSAWAYWWLYCRDKRDGIIDSTEPGGSGDPFATLTNDQREAMATLYRRGWPRHAESQLWSFVSWLVILSGYKAADPTYFQDFWSKLGYLGHDNPERLAPVLVDQTLTVAQVAPAQLGPPIGATVDGIIVDGDLGDARQTFMNKVTVLSGRAKGREAFVTMNDEGTLIGSPLSGLDLFDDVEPGDQIRLDNRDLVAYAYLWRHAVDIDGMSIDDPVTGERRLATEFAEVNAVLVDGKPIYPQRPPSGVARGTATGRFNGKMIQIVGTHDSMIMPTWVPPYERLVRAHHGDETDDHFRVWWVENAPHGSPEYLLTWSTPETDPGVWRSRLVPYDGVASQALADLVRWVEDGIAPPASTGHRFTRDGGLVLATSASERAGVQPVVSVSASCGGRVRARVSEPVTFEGTAQQPPGTGTIVYARWDFEGTGNIDLEHDIDGESETVKVEATYAYSQPGTYFASLQVGGHRDGSKGVGIAAANVARVRIVVS